MFTVPQFIDVEDKVFGPVTVRQFILLLGGCAISGIGFLIFDFSLRVVWIFFWMVFAVIFAFVRINGRPFHYFILNIVQTSKKPKLRVWNHRGPAKDALLSDENSGQDFQTQIKKIPSKPRPAGSRLRELSLIVDTKGVYKGGEEDDLVGL
jgi:hypothetical protein